MNRSKFNRYTCQQCGQGIITVDADEGTTPFMLGCRATPKCDGMMMSSFYRVSESEGPATFAWRKPTKAEYKRASSGMQQHFDMGGLDIYPLPSPPR
jgi:hypothetical protein